MAGLSSMTPSSRSVALHVSHAGETPGCIRKGQACSEARVKEPGGLTWLSLGHGCLICGVEASPEIREHGRAHLKPLKPDRAPTLRRSSTVENEWGGGAGPSAAGAASTHGALGISFGSVDFLSGLRVHLQLTLVDGCELFLLRAKEDDKNKDILFLVTDSKAVDTLGPSSP